MYLTTEERELQKKLMDRMLAIPDKLQRHLADMQRGQWAIAQVAGLPEAPSDQIQDLQPGSPTFGQYYMILDLSPFGAILH